MVISQSRLCVRLGASGEREVLSRYFSTVTRRGFLCLSTGGSLSIAGIFRHLGSSKDHSNYC